MVLGRSGGVDHLSPTWPKRKDAGFPLTTAGMTGRGLREGQGGGCGKDRAGGGKDRVGGGKDRDFGFDFPKVGDDEFLDCLFDVNGHGGLYHT